MTPEQLTLARQFCDAVGWEVKPVADGGFLVMRPDGAWTGITWLVCGNGMLAVKAEMAKRDKPLASLQDSKLAMAWWPIHDVSRASFADSEPHAVLLAAVAAMKGDNGQA